MSSLILQGAIVLSYLLVFFHFVLTAQPISGWFATLSFKHFWLFHFIAITTILSERLFSTRLFTLHSLQAFQHIDDSDEGRDCPSRILLYLYFHRVIPSGCAEFLTTEVEVRTSLFYQYPVSHEAYTEYVLDKVLGTTYNCCHWNIHQSNFKTNVNGLLRSSDQIFYICNQL